MIMVHSCKRHTYYGEEIQTAYDGAEFRCQSVTVKSLEGLKFTCIVNEDCMA